MASGSEISHSLQYVVRQYAIRPHSVGAAKRAAKIAEELHGTEYFNIDKRANGWSVSVRIEEVSELTGA
jgi:hypothetical protein